MGIIIIMFSQIKQVYFRTYEVTGANCSFFDLNYSSVIFGDGRFNMKINKKTTSELDRKSQYRFTFIYLALFVRRTTEIRNVKAKICAHNRNSCAVLNQYTNLILISVIIICYFFLINRFFFLPSSSFFFLFV